MSCRPLGAVSLCLSPAAVNGGGDGHCTWQECLQAAFRQVYKIYYVRMDLGSWYVVAYRGILVLATTLDIYVQHWPSSSSSSPSIFSHTQSQSWDCAAFMQIERSLEDRAITHYIHLLCIALYHIMASVHILTLPDHRSRHNNNNNIVSLQQYNCMFTKYGHLDSDHI